MAQRLQHRAEKNEKADHRGNERNGAGYEPPIANASQPQDGNHQHKRDTNRNSGGAPGVWDLKRRGGHEDLVGRELISRMDHEDEKGQGRADRDQVEERPRARP